MHTTLRFKLERETKGALRFQETALDGTPADPYVIGTLYLRKSATPTPWPRAIEITVRDVTSGA